MMIAPAPSANGSAFKEKSTPKALWQVLQRNRWIVLLTPLLTLAATIVFIRMTTPIYEGSATLRVDRERSQLAALDALQQLSTSGEIQTEVAELRTMHLSSAVVDSLDLHVVLTQPKGGSRSAFFSQLEASRAAEPANLVIERSANNQFTMTTPTGQRPVRIGELVQLRGLQFMLSPEAARHDRISLRVTSFNEAVRGFMRTRFIGRPDREASVVLIRYESPDRELAMTVPNVIAAQFLSRRDSVRKTQARSTVDFLITQIDTLGMQLRTAEVALLNFQQRERVVSPAAEAEQQVIHFADLQAEREAYEAERNSIASVLGEIERDPAGRETNVYRKLLFIPALLKMPASSELIRNLNELENKRLELRERRKDTDPELMNVIERIRELDTQLQTMASTYVQGLASVIANTDRTLAGFSGQLTTIPAKEMQLARLRRQSKVTEELYTALQLRLKEGQIAAAVDDPSISVIDPAIFPDRPIRPNVPLSIALALLLGSALGIGIAVARQQLDTTIRSRDELQELNRTVPVLGQVPRIPIAGGRAGMIPFLNQNGHRRPGAKRTVIHLGDGAVAEAYRTLRTNLAFSQTDRPTKFLVVTSALPGEGKSTSAYNLSLTLARQGLRVILVDADMRRGGLHSVLAADFEPGLSNVLSGQAALADALQSVIVEGVGIAFISAGTTPPNPAELIASNRMNRLLDELGNDFDVVVIDTPPLNVVSDAALFVRPDVGVLMVARSGVTERLAYRHALEQLESARACVIGSILNDVEARTQGYYGRGKAAAYYASATLNKQS